MFKNKERRDTILLLIMAAVTIAFLVYVLVPFGGGDNNGGKSPPIGPKPDTPPIKPDQPVQQVLPDEPSEKDVLDDLNQKIESILNTLYTDIVHAEEPFENYDITSLKNLPEEFQNKLVDKLYRFSFSDLKDIPRLEFPETYSNALKFNLYVSLFLLKVREEGIERKLADTPNAEFAKTLNLECFQLLRSEIEEDFQLLPVLFYFKLLVQRLDPYQPEDMTAFFKQGTSHMRDLTPQKLLIRIREILSFSQHTESYRLHWKEHDTLSADDKETYNGLSFTTYNFLTQEYLVLPDKNTTGSGRWLTDLCNSDSGNIEMKEFSIQNQDPSRKTGIQKIIYTPLKNTFVVVLKESVPAAANPDEGFLTYLLARRMLEFHRSYTILDFRGLAEKLKEEQKAFRESLEAFGNYLKKTNTPEGK